MFHKVVQVVPKNDYKVFIYFSDGKVKLFNAKELVTKGVFQQLKDINVFMNTCTVMNDTLAWDISGKFDSNNCLDVDAEQLYNSCPEVEEPNISTAI